jgi:hypothetical protein
VWQKTGVADVVTFFLAPEDEVALFRQLEPLHLSIYPELVNPAEPPLPLNGAAAPQLDLPSYYLAAEHLGTVEVYPIKRGPNRGRYAIDEIRSPVIHYERSLREEDTILSGRIWAELVVSQSTAANVGKSEAFRQLFHRVRDQLHRFQRSRPVGAFIGPQAARLFKTGVKLRSAGRHGKPYEPFR